MSKDKFLTFVFCGLLALFIIGITGCTGGNSSSSASSPQSVNAVNLENTSAATSNNATTNDKTSTTSDVEEYVPKQTLTTVDNVDINEIAFAMVGSTPNLQIIITNNTSKDLEFKPSKIKITGSNGAEIPFLIATKTIPANTSIQEVFISESKDMKVGDKVAVSYDGKDLGTYEVKSI